MEQNEHPCHTPIEITTDTAQVRMDVPITRPELDARFREVRTRIWFATVASFLGAAAGGKLGFGPHEAVSAIGRLLT